MKIQLGNHLDKEKIQEEISKARIVDEGDYLLTLNTNRILVSDGYSMRYLAASEICYITSKGTYNEVCGLNESFSTTQSLATMESDLLVRISKSTIVNINFIEDINVKFNMKLALKVNDVWLDVNRSYYRMFKERIGIE